MSEPLAIYIHWPYCHRICPYCDFNVYKARQDPDLVGAIITDLSDWRDFTGPRRVGSIHFGGGTPSLLSPGHVASLIEHIDRIWGCEPECEIALEANPGDMNKDQCQNMVVAGVTRLSLGVQSFHDEALNMLGRDHNGDEARRSLDIAQKFCPSVSADLIFGWADQREDQWQADLNQALSLGLSHLSTYQLTIEPQTAFAKAQMRGAVLIVDTDSSATLYEIAQYVMAAAGFIHYEVSNFAKPGHKSRHNLTYWRGGDYVGVGPGAHGRLGQKGVRWATQSYARPHDYVTHVQDEGSGRRESEILSREEWGDEYVLMGLRADEGISLSKYRQIRGHDLNLSDINDLCAAGVLIHKGDRIRITKKGRSVTDAITQRLIIASV